MVSEFTFIDSPDGLSTTPFRIWARPEAISQAELKKTCFLKALYKSHNASNYFDSKDTPVELALKS